MARSLTDLIDKLNIKIRDKTNGTIESNDAKSLFNDAIDKLKSFHEFPGTKQRADLDVFSGIYEYPVPTGYKSMIDINVDSSIVDFEMKSAKSFWHDKNFGGNLHADDNINETKLLLINRATNKGIITVHDCESLTSNGTWAVTVVTDATNLTLDSTEKQSGSASLNFDITVANSVANFGAIQNSTITALDMSGHEDKSTIFLDADLPDVTNITSITFEWGSDSSNYWSQTVTTAFNGTSFKNGNNKLGFAWNGATATGTPNSSSVDFIKYTVTYSASQVDDTDFRLDNIVSIMPERLSINYYSNNFAKSTAGAYLTEFSDVTDTSILEDHENQLLLLLALEGAFDILREFDESAKARNSFSEFFRQIANDKPSEEDKATDDYYYFG